MEFSGHCLSFAFSRNWFLTYIQTWIMANDFIWILSHHINLGTSITATFNYCFCYHYSNDTSLYQWWYEQTFAFYESCSKTRFYYYFLSFYLYMSNIIIIIIIMVLFFLALILLLLFTLLLLLWILFMLTLMWVYIMLYHLRYYINLLLCDF